MSRRSGVRGALALGFYLVGAIVLFGRAVVLAPATTVVGDAGADKSIPMWSFVWWPHALAHGHDPFAADVVWAPHGIDLAWVTAVPGVSLVASPLTALVGPIATYNVVVLAAPALSAWTMYLLARRVTHSFAASLAAGWIFGFSAYQIGHMVGHLNLVLIALVPVCALLVLRHHAGDIRTRRFVLSLALALAGQFLISTETFTTLLLVGLLFALLALGRLDAAGRARLRVTVTGAVGAALLAAAIVSPYLVHAFIVSSPSDAPLRSPFSEAADLLNYLVPTRRIWLRPDWADALTNDFTATGAERGAYLGLPLATVAVLFAFGWRRARSRPILVFGFLALVVASLGSQIRADGRPIAKGPWKLVAKLPIVDQILPGRLTLYVALLVALMAAIWLDERAKHPRWRWALVLVGIALALPNPADRLWRSTVPNPAFFSDGTYARYINRGETVLVAPFGGAGWSLLWQAETGIYFRLVGGHMGREVIGAEDRWRSVYHALGPGPTPPSLLPMFRLFLGMHRVGAIIVAPHAKLRVRRLIEALGIKPVPAAGVLVYRLHYLRFAGLGASRSARAHAYSAKEPRQADHLVARLEPGHVLADRLDASRHACVRSE